MSKKLTIEFIREEFEKEGYVLLTEVYKGAFQKLDYICPKKHCHFISWSNWKKGRRCVKCHGHERFTLEFVNNLFKKEGYTLLTKIYKNNHQRLDYICPNGHQHFTSLINWRKGVRCVYCCGKHIPVTIERIKEQFKKKGYTLLTTEYRNDKQRLDCICPEGHEYTTTWGSFGAGYGCSHCAGNAKLTIEFIRSEFEKEDYILLTTVYEGNKQKLDYICSKGHKHSISWHKWKFGRRCPYCNNNSISKWEKVIKSFIDKSNINYVPNDRSQLTNPETGCTLELDIWFPDLNKAIECNGVYWHSKPDRKRCDKIKKQLCKNQGINLLVITDEEWNDDTDKCKAKLIKFVEI
jgi:hypothetical protein